MRVKGDGKTLRQWTLVGVEKQSWSRHRRDPSPTQVPHLASFWLLLQNLLPALVVAVLTLPAAMKGSQLVALAILAAYFGLILLVFGAIVAQIRGFKASWNRRASAFVTLTALSFGYTWYCKPLLANFLSSY